MRRPNGQRSDRHPRIAIVGAGFGGIGAAVWLTKAGLHNFQVFEQSAGPGGVWWDNRYPGAEVDTPSHMYSFSFKRWNWSRSHAQQAELQAYLQATIDDWNLGDRFHFNTRVDSLTWLADRARYEVAIGDRVEEFDFVISAVGLLNVPRLPTWPGLDQFSGAKMHTAQWDRSVDLSGKRVALVGTGSTAAQLAPRIADQVATLHVFQREPGWINPKPVVEYTPMQREALQNRWRYRMARMRGYWQAAGTREGGDIHIDGSRSNRAAMEACTAYIKRALPDRPDLQKLVTPQYGYFGKRPIKDSNFYPTLLKDNVELVPNAVEYLTETEIVDSTGAAREIDAVIMATGFQPANYLARLKVVGRGGRELHEVWGGEPAAYLGIEVPCFPNFFMIYGPNTNSPVTVFFLEQQARFAVRAIKWTMLRGKRSIEVRRTAFQRFDAWMQRQMAGSVWATANNYFRTASGRVVTQWPVSPTLYWLLAKLTPEISAQTKR